MAQDPTQLSKFLSLVLRHNPQEIGLALDAGGWAEIEQIIARANFPVTSDQIDKVVRDSDKQRFSLSPDGKRIRANQGHSFPVDLGLTLQNPPETLWHGTAEATLPAILAEGLRPMGRQHVHLSPDPDTARKVGARHGRPVVLTVAAGQLARTGHLFYCSVNSVWLTDTIPPEAISL